MKIRGIYVLSQKSVKRLIAATATAFVSICVSAASPEDMALASRFANAALLLMSLKCTLAASSATRAAVPDFMYLESKSLYLMMRPAEAKASHLAKPPPPPPVVSSSVPPSQRPATKSDLRAAVKTILRGEDVNVTKTGPRLTPAKRRQIAAAEKYRATHCGCTLRNACLRSFLRAADGYASALSLYEVLRRKWTS